MKKEPKHLDMHRPEFSETTPRAVERHVEGWRRKGYKTVTVRVKWLHQVIQHYKGLQKSEQRARRKIETLKEKLAILRSQPRVIIRKKDKTENGIP